MKAGKLSLQILEWRKVGTPHFSAYNKVFDRISSRKQVIVQSEIEKR